MHDIRFIRENPDAFDAALKRRGQKVVSDALSSINQILADRETSSVAQGLIAIDEERRALTTEVQVAQSRRNEASKLIGAAMGKGDKDTAEALKAEVATLKEAMPALEARADEVAAKLKAALEIIPNLPAADVPDGADEDANVEVSPAGEPRESLTLPPKNTPISRQRWAWILKPARGCQVRGLRFCAETWRASIAPWANSCSTCRRASMAMRNVTRRCWSSDDAMYGTDKLPKFAGG
jgi:seryl-tRNA synthetase